MSVMYTVKEHLRVPHTQEYPQIVSYVLAKLDLLGEAMQSHKAIVHQALVVTEARAVAFAGADVDERFENARGVIGGAKALELTLEYRYRSYAGNDDREPGPFAMMEVFKEWEKTDPEGLNGLFYSVYFCDDICESGMGLVAAYGCKNGQRYDGVLRYRELAELPDGAWFSPVTALAVEPSQCVPHVDFEAVEKVCRQLRAFSSEDDCWRDEDGVFFYLNHLELQNDAQMRTFAKLCAELMTLIGGKASMELQLSDLSGADPKAASVTIRKDGTYTVYCMMAE